MGLDLKKTLRNLTTRPDRFIGNLGESVSTISPLLAAVAPKTFADIVAKSGDLGNFAEWAAGSRETLNGSGILSNPAISAAVTSFLANGGETDQIPKVVAAALLKDKLKGTAAGALDKIVASGGNSNLAAIQGVTDLYKTVTEPVIKPQNTAQAAGTPLNQIGQTGNLFSMIDADLYVTDPVTGQKTLRPLDERQMTPQKYWNENFNAEDYQRLLDLREERDRVSAAQYGSGLDEGWKVDRLRELDKEIMELGKAGTEAEENYTTRVLDIFGNPEGGKYDGRYYNSISNNSSLAFDPVRGVVPKSDDSPLGGVFGSDVKATDQSLENKLNQTNPDGTTKKDGLESSLGALALLGGLGGLLGNIFGNDDKPGGGTSPGGGIGGVGGGGLPSYSNLLGLPTNRDAKDYLDRLDKHRGLI